MGFDFDKEVRMHEAVPQIAEMIEEGISASDLEEVCRQAVAEEILDRARLITEDEVRRLIEPIVRHETAVDPAEAVDGGEVRLTDVEYDSLDPEQRAEDARTGARLVMIGSRAYPARISPDQRAVTIAASLSREVAEAAYGVCLANGWDADSMYREAADAPACPGCGSLDTTPVWFDAGRMTVHCNGCGNEFEADMDEGPDELSMRDRTVEEYDVVPEAGIYASVWFEGSDSEFRPAGFRYEVHMGDEVLYEGWSETSEGAFDAVEAYAAAYRSIEEGLGLLSTESGVGLTVDGVDGDEVRFGGRTGSRARIASALSRGVFQACRSEMYDGFVAVGDVYENAEGDSMEVYASEGGDVAFYDTRIAPASGRITVMPVSMRRGEFLRRVDEGGYEIVQ